MRIYLCFYKHIKHIVSTVPKQRSQLTQNYNEMKVRDILTLG